MAHDIMGKFYTILNLPLHDKINELTNIIDLCSPNKEMQTLFPQLINNIFSTTLFQNGWGLRNITFDGNKYEFMLLISFFEPQGPMFRLCYKLLSDPQLRYNIPLDVLPLDLRRTLERGRYPQFYADLINVDPQTMKPAGLALNPFDYYIFNFALFLTNGNENKTGWDHWNSVYFALACDYLMHFLPADPNVSVLPQVLNFSGKAIMTAPLQSAHRPLYTPSFLLVHDLGGMSTQTAAQSQSRNEVWRSESVLQVFVDVWMSVDDGVATNMELLFKSSYQADVSSPEQVRTVRVLVKHIHAYSAKHIIDPIIQSSTLRKYARQMLCTRAYHYVTHLVKTWPLDASFRLVMELWLSLIQPWRYTDNGIKNDRYLTPAGQQEEGSAEALDASYTQFIAENFPAYTCILNLVLPRFLRMDLTVYKNAIMLFRLGKVFSQTHLATILRELEQAILTNEHSHHYYNGDVSWNNSNFDQSPSNNNSSSHKWVAVAKQAITELNLSTEFEYVPIWGESRRSFAYEFVTKIASANMAAENNVQDYNQKLQSQNKGLWASVKNWLMINVSVEEEMQIEEMKKVPVYLNAAVQQFSQIFGLTDRNFSIEEPAGSSNLATSNLENSSFGHSTSIADSITNKLRSIPKSLHYMGDPDVAPITSYESTILVRILYQIASRLNDTYRNEFAEAWHRNDFIGCIAREILQKPCTIQSYMKSNVHQNIVATDLPARLSLRRFGSHSCIVWLTLGYIFFKLLSYSGWFYLFFLVVTWSLVILSKAAFKYVNSVRE